MTMKTMLIVCSVLATTTVFDAALAASQWSDQNSDYRAQREGVYANPYAPRLFRGGSECGAGRASPVWGQNGSIRGYECTDSANGS
jgi:hypothetical protein